jgi:hypothetical protein
MTYLKLANAQQAKISPAYVITKENLLRINEAV